MVTQPEKTTRSILPSLALLGFIVLFLLFATGFPLLAQNQSMIPDVENIVKKIDQLYRSDTSRANMEMQIVTPHWKRTLALEVWTKGMDRTFVLITSPKKEKGVTTLRIENEMWNYLPKTNKAMKVPPSMMMMGSWMGSDFTKDDLVRESSMLADYTYYAYPQCQDRKWPKLRWFLSSHCPTVL